VLQSRPGSGRFPEFADDAPGLIYQKLTEGEWQKRSDDDAFLGWCFTVLKRVLLTQIRSDGRQREHLQRIDPGRQDGVRAAPEPDHLSRREQWFRANASALVCTEELPELDLDEIARWKPRDRILLPAYCGFWHRIPHRHWLVWVYEAGVGASRHFPSREFFEEDGCNLRHEILARDLGMSTQELSYTLRNKWHLLDCLSAFTGGPS
jgi:hypothetical protein